ncbi:MAG TPA: saccharopine dehydrogenase NADP-binding domain-containing protein [Thermoplasmata archaeon]|nr:saccharopine dehydrogenase NADP-binding domain-containing protein [Thermoplasmata archaeon]
MRVAILGAGGLGRTLVSELRADPRVTGLMVLDRVGDRARVLAGLRERVPIQAHAVNVENVDLLTRTLRGFDVAVNATLPKYNLTIMRACLDAGVGYLDTSAAGPSRPGGPLGIFEQLELDDAFRSAGVTALLSMGLDPGMTNVLAREASEALDRIDAIRIRSCSTAKLPGFENFPLYSREAFLDDFLVRPTVWIDGRLEEREPMAEEEAFDFPPPVGSQRTFLASHEEVKTLPRFLGKPVGRIDFKYGLSPSLAHAILSLERLGLFREDRTIRLGGQRVPFRKVFLSVFPEPSAILVSLEGAEAVSVEVEGMSGSSRVVQRRDIVLTHHEANRRRSTTAVQYLSAVGAAIGVVLIGEKATPGPGVHPPETLDPARVFKEWAARDLPLQRSVRVIEPSTRSPMPGKRR